MKNVKMGIIGLGAEGGLYAGFLADGKVKGMVIGAICDIDPAKKPCAQTSIRASRSITTISTCWRAEMLTLL